MSELLLPVSVGEALDKYSILQIKRSEVGDSDRLEHIRKEIAAIFPCIERILHECVYHYECLHYVNKKIWDLSDQIRDDSISDSDKIGLYAETFTWNDARFRIKSKFNELLSSALKEQKSYAVSGIVISPLPSILDYEMCSLHIRYLSIRYDIVNVQCSDALRKEVAFLFQDDPHIVVGAYTFQPSTKVERAENTMSIPMDFSLLKRSPSGLVRNYVVGGKLGDFLHLLYVVMCKYLVTGAKGKVYITDDRKYGGDSFTTNAKTVHADLYKIIEAQPYIESFSVLTYQDIPFDVNLNDFRRHGIIWSMGWMNFLPKIFHTPPILGPWIHLPDDCCTYEDVVLIHRSKIEARHNPSFVPILQRIVDNNKCMFITCDQAEYDLFPFQDSVPLSKVDTLEEMYKAIHSCTFFIGNQSSPLTIAYSLGKPCLCESTQFTFYTDPHRPNNTFYWESDANNFFVGITNYIHMEKVPVKMSFYGQFMTDKFIRKYFPKEDLGTCIDVGMGGPISGNNTYHFEENGWTCLCIEPNSRCCRLAKGIRKHIENVACGAEHLDDQRFDVYTINGDNQTAISSLKPDERLVENHRHMINSVDSIRVNVRTLDEVLAKHPYIKTIDFISIDTENTELDVLKGFDIEKWKPKLLVIENNYDEPFLGEYLKPFGYERAERVVVNDFFVRSD